MTPVVWVIGAKGLLGKELCEAITFRGWTCLQTDKEIDITDRVALRAFSLGRKIDYMINCAAYTAVDTAENDSEQAFLINATGAENCARTAAETGAVLVHISTDYIFDGHCSRPYTENDIPHPCNVYGASKLEGEQRIAKCADKYFIIRTAGLFGVHGKNFVATMLSLFSKKSELHVVDDQIATPTYAVDLADAVCRIIDTRSTEYGIYHFTNQGQVTWYELACALYTYVRTKGLCSHKVHIKPVSSAEYGSIAVRPLYSVLSKEKFTRVFAVSIPSWEDALTRYVGSLTARTE